MTIAIDRESGEVLGQYIDRQPGVRGPGETAVPQVLLLTAHGYATVSAWAVRLEVVR